MGLLREQFDHRRGIGKPVGMVVATVLRKDLEAPAGFLPEVDEGFGVIDIRHGFVGCAMHGDQENAVLNGGSEAIGWTDGFLDRLFIGGYGAQ